MSASLGAKLGLAVRTGVALGAILLLPACSGDVDLSTPDPSITVTTPTVPVLPTTVPTLPALPTTLPRLVTTTTTSSTTSVAPTTTTTTLASDAPARDEEAEDDDWDAGPPASLDEAAEGFGDALGSGLFLAIAALFAAIGAAILGLFMLPLAGCGFVFFPLLPLAILLSVLLTALLGLVGFVVAMALTYAIARSILRLRST